MITNIASAAPSATTSTSPTPVIESSSSLLLDRPDPSTASTFALAGPSTGGNMPSRPLSEISENEDRRRSSQRLSQPRSNDKGSRPASRSASRPTSQVLDDKRLSAQIQTITLNLNDYAAAVKRPASGVSSKSRDSLVSNPPAPLARSTSASAGPSKPERPPTIRTTSISSIKEVKREEPEDDDLKGHPLLMAKRASLRPSPLGATYAEVVKPTSPNTPTSESVISLNSTSESSSKPPPPPPPTKAKPSWLRRASGTSALRSKSRSPVQEDGITASTSLPPALPPRNMTAAVASTSMLDRTRSPDSYASVLAGPSRSQLAEGSDRPAISPPARDMSIRDRISAWTTQGSMPRSDSSATLASTYSRQDRFNSAQRMIGTAGSAVQKGWAGLRARGVGGSISSMSALGRRESLDPPKVSRKSSRDRSVSAQATMLPDGPLLDGTAIKRQAGFRTGLVFGKDLVVVGREWGVVEEPDLSEWEKRRRAVLPAVVVRCVDYLTIWGPKEEGIFRISGRSSHVLRLRKDFDSGADLDLRDCHPGDLDPHAISGILKSYLRELPSPLLTKSLQPRFEETMKDDGDISELLQQLPLAHWFLLADLVQLLSLIAQHTTVNRMTINALMLSLGPSLNIPGNVFTELVDRRDELFKSPPQTELLEMASLIDFGETSIPPVIIPADSISRSTTPVSMADGKPRRSPLLGAKPSLTRLFTGGTAPNMARRGSADTTISSIVGLNPPRVEVSTDSPRLPSFESDRGEDADKVTVKDKPLPLEPIISASNTMQDVRASAGTVEELTRAFSSSTSSASTSTPIADMFTGQSQMPPTLRHQRSTNSMFASSSVPVIGLQGVDSSANPASIIRRGQAGFFGGGARQDRQHSRSQSLAVNSNKAAGDMSPPPLPPRSREQKQEMLA